MLTQKEIDALVYASREAEEGPNQLVRRVEAAVREACAKIAERRGMEGYPGICREIGAEIRAGGGNEQATLSSNGTAAGECFEPGQIWLSPRGFVWGVVGYASRQGKRKQAVLRQGVNGVNGVGRKQERDWDAVQGWVIHQHADGTLTGAGAGV